MDEKATLREVLSALPPLRVIACAPKCARDGNAGVSVAGKGERAEHA
jgi:hypothetical protein